MTKLAVNNKKKKLYSICIKMLFFVLL